MTSTPILDFATATAQEAGLLAQTLRAEAPADFVANKGEMDFITHADRAVEALIRARLAAAFPDDAIFGEEEGGTPQGTFWVIDPIDGTTNYLKGRADWGVCLARIRNGAVTDGVIICPDLNWGATATRGQGVTFLGGLETSRTDGAIALVELGYSARISLSEHLAQIEGIIAHGADYRRCGAACVGLLSVAAGRSDVFYERHLNLWDAAPALLILSEAGGLCLHDDIPRFARQGSEVLALSASRTGEAEAWKDLLLGKPAGL